MTDTVVADGQVKFRDGKKWRTRWVVLRKPSPVADCLSLLVYKEKKKGKGKAGGPVERLSVTLEGICGVEPGPGFDGVSYSLSILCLAHTLVLGFNSRDALLAWDGRVRYSLGEVHRFSVAVEPGTKLESGPASLHLCNNLLVLSRGAPPAVAGHWKLSALRRYGAVPKGFVFEGGTRCGYWAGVFFLSCSDGEQISFLFDCIVRGITPSRARHGLRPALPADPSADPVSAEERISQEAAELEKRLSMLSHCSLASSTASTYSCSTSVAGDDQSIISSSSSSQSDTSYGCRLPFWAEPSARPQPPGEAAASSSTLKALTDAAAMAGCGPALRPSSAQLPPRRLHDSGRQSSLDSGIGIAAGSHSSSSGSFSSCTGSVDTGSQAGGGDFGSVCSLPGLPPPPPSSPPSAPPSTPPAPPSPFPRTPTPEHSAPTPCPCPSPCSCASRSGSCVSRRHSDEYQIPCLLWRRYDTPRSLLHTPSPRDPPAREGPPALGSGGGGGPAGHSAQRQAAVQRSFSWGSERAPPVDGQGSSTARPPPCGGAQLYITAEQWSASTTRSTPVAISPSPPGLRPSAGTQGSVCSSPELHGDAGDQLTGLRRSAPSLPPPPPPPPPLPAALSKPRQTSGAFQSAYEAPPCLFLDTGLYGDSTLNYVNIPVSPPPARRSRELVYSELDLQGGGSAPISGLHSAIRGEGSIRYAHLDIGAMETAQRVGAEHVQGREVRLTQLESGRPN